MPARITAPALLLLLCLCSCARLADRVPRKGDEIMVCGRMFHTGTPVVLWTDPGGYDAYRVERRFAPLDESSWEKSKDKLSSPNRYGVRASGLTPEELERVRGGGWDLETLRRHVDQFVIHYDAAGTSRACFRTLHDGRGLSVHFMIDLDGTVYQTLDVKERAWHATIANDRSVGVEIANIGAYPAVAGSPLEKWYGRDGRGPLVTLPPGAGGGGQRRAGFVARSARDAPVAGAINGATLVMYDLTPEQYDALTHLAATLCTVLPGIRPDAPRGDDGAVLARTLTAEEFGAYRGLLGHYHIQKDKVDPGPAFDWERMIAGTRSLMRDRPPVTVREVSNPR